jgi:hypothetical protein
MFAGLHTEPDKKAALGKKVGAVAHLAFDNPFEFGAQNNVLEPVGLGPSGRKVGLVGFGMDLFAQKDVLAGCQVVLEQPRVVLAEQMAERLDGWLTLRLASLSRWMIRADSGLALLHRRLARLSRRMPPLVHRLSSGLALLYRRLPPLPRRMHGLSSGLALLYVGLPPLPRRMTRLGSGLALLYVGLPPLAQKDTPVLDCWLTLRNISLPSLSRGIPCWKPGWPCWM